MKETIANDEKSRHILNKLISEDFYEGVVQKHRFELSRKKGFFNIADSYSLIGNLNEQNRFDLEFEFKALHQILIKIALVLGLLFTIFSIFSWNWFLPLVFVGFPFFTLMVSFQLKKKKEINLFI